MRTFQARIDESVDELICKLNALAGEMAMDALARRMKQKPRRSGQRRSQKQIHRKPEEIAALTEELYEQICRHPGETMRTLSVHVKQPAKVLAFPARKLIKTGRIKKVGQRQFMRYFPVGREAKSTRRTKTR
jgi:hypothetical protein